MVVDLASGTVAGADALPDLLTNQEYKTTKLVLRRLSAGSFQMGDHAGEGEANELPVHAVNITSDFYLGVFEVTQQQWFEIEGDWPAYNILPGCETRPVEQVTWARCDGFLGALSSLTSRTFRFPTEAEWEYACRAGTTTSYSYGDTADGAYMWYDSNCSGTNEVGTREPNPWGLYDMHGNVDEWCVDWYDENYYSVSPTNDPQGPASGTYHVARGGSWRYSEYGGRSAFRMYGEPPEWTEYGNIFGLRVAVSVE